MPFGNKQEVFYLGFFGQMNLFDLFSMTLAKFHGFPCIEKVFPNSTLFHTFPLVWEPCTALIRTNVYGHHTLYKDEAQKHVWYVHFGNVTSKAAIFTRRLM